MVNSQKLDFNQYHGKRVINDILNIDGELLVPSFTVLNTEHIQLLEQHHDALMNEQLEVMDVVPYGKLTVSENDKLIDGLVARLQHIFQEIHSNRTIPLADIRNHIVPSIQQLVKQPSLLSFLAALHTKEDYVYRHSFAVGAISTLIGKWLNFQDNELLQLTTAAVIHDVGKMQIPDAVLNKPGKLTTAEEDTMKSHTFLGYELIKNTIGTNHRQALAALQHHERLDGKGYPLGAAGGQIDLFARIVSVADAFHAMASQRVYSTSLPFYEILSQIEQDTYTKFDPNIVRVLVDKVMQSTVGYKAILTDGTLGKIVHFNTQHPKHPLVQVDDQFLDLSINPSLKIEQIII